MAFEIPTIKYAGAIKQVTLGKGDKALKVGGETAYPFHSWEGKTPSRPIIAMEVWDFEPTEWPEAAKAPFEGVLGDPAAWAKKNVEEYGADAIVVQLKSTDPNGMDASPEAASEAVGKVLGAVDVPVIVWGSANPAKDAEVLKKIAEDYAGKNLLLGPVDEDNHKQIGAAALAYDQSLISSSPIDVNLAKQLNILLGNLGVSLDRLVIDPTTGGLGYGMEYSYSVMERIRAAALVQDDDKLVLPMINNVGNEVWKCKEANQTNEDAPELGDAMKRGVYMETAAAVSYLLAGSDVLLIRHPETVKQIKAFISAIMADRAPAAEKAAVDRPKAAALAGAKPKAAPKPAAAAPKPAAAAPKPAAAAPKLAAVPEPEAAPAAAAPAADPEAEAKAKAAAEAKAAADAEAKKKADAEAAAKAAADAEEAKKKAVADAEAARQAEKDKERAELDALRAKRREERMAHLREEHEAPEGEEGVEYGEPRPAGVAGPDAVFVLKSLSRWRLRGDGVMRK
ncbi:acetyl-CoA decarbonylase/synthase complex subunit delta [Desulfoferula mesophila]|uniref:CO dehydrogenase/acetyl-CoA synthase delta subunit TIM barrel domain-containing protein n=1 Tax=Desulfoferula mesophila TaxID=3058419 RepID=A0AAU9ELA2_9BACT|nr:hypothetical protein FAK_42030 [Desulfoferula mesophilus]